MLVDMEEQTIKWMFEGEQFSFSTLTNYLRDQDCVAYVSMVHVKDVVIISPKRDRERSRSRSRSPAKKDEVVGA